MERIDNPYDSPVSELEGNANPSDRKSTVIVDWLPNALFLVLVVTFFFIILHLYQTEGNTNPGWNWSVIPVGICAVVAFCIAMFQNIQKKRAILAIVITPIGLFTVAYLWMLVAPVIDRLSG
jgi:hypothetical protein